jgi:hypothetical protein
MKKNFWIIIALLLLAFPAITTAGMTGKELLQKCEPIEKLNESSPSLTSQETTGIVYCLGYIDSFIDTFYFQVQAKIVQTVPYCLPKETHSRKKYAFDVVNYMKNELEELGKPAGFYIFMGLRNAYPCNEKTDADDAKSEVSAEPEKTDKPVSK